MNLTLPGVSTEPGPDWANQINASLLLIDAHDHSSGKGVKITPSGMNITSDLSFQSQGATNLGYLMFSQTSAPAANDSVFVNTDGDLQWKTVNGTYTILTSTGSAAAVGGFTGDYASTDAEANYSDLTKSYSFLQDTGISASVNCGPLSIFENVLSSNSVTIDTVSSLAASYTLTLPSALPSATALLTFDTSGNLANLETGLQSLTSDEVTQLGNIDSNTISNTQWGYLGGLDQALTQASNVTFNDLTATGNLTLGTAGDADAHVLNGSTFLLKGDSSAGTLDNPGSGFFSVGNRGANFLIGEGTAGGGAIQGLFINQNVNFDGTNYVAHTGGINTTQLRVGNSSGGSTASDAVVLRTNNGSATGSGVTIALSQVLSMSNDGGIYTKNGSSSSVGHGFELAKNTGMWRSAGGNLLFARSGTDIFGITSTAGFAGTDNAFDWGTSSFAWDDVYAYGYPSPSDRRLKTNIQDSDLGLDFINSLRPVSYVWKEGGKRWHYGVIAQELRDAILATGKTTETMAAFIHSEHRVDEEGNQIPDSDRMCVRYSELIAPIMKAIQELTERLEALESK